MFIAIDIGNTNITVSVRTEKGWEEFRLASDEAQPMVYYTHQLEIIASGFDLEKLEGVGVSSVVPHLTDVIMDATAIEIHKEPLLLQKKYYHLMPIETPNPEEMGTDLFANALAGYLKANGPCLIVDFGTALTYTLVNANKQIEGVAIAPGIRTAMESLSGKAAQLPEIPLELPEKLLGTNTVEAMNSGILWGYVGQVSYMVEKIRKSVDYPITVIATGGLSQVIKPLESNFDFIDRDLTVTGIYEFFKRVVGNQA
jgi:type III pantothenate kinase